MRSASARLIHQLPRGSYIAWAMVLLLVMDVANSTVLANWVPQNSCNCAPPNVFGGEVLPTIGLAAAGAMGVLAMRFVPGWVSLLAGTALGLALSVHFAWPAMHLAHPEDGAGIPAVQAWLHRLLTGEVAGESSFFLWLLCVLFWLAGGWMAWAVLRWRQPLLGLAPLAAAFATNLLNYPAGQNGFLVYFLILILAILLWVGYQRSLEGARRAGLKISSDSSWDFWETGVVVAAVVVMLGLFLPPISTVDRTAQAQSGLFQNWAQLQARLSHPFSLGPGPATPGTSVGFSTDVSLRGPLQRTPKVVFTYTIGSSYSGPRYFRGADAVETVNGTWTFPSDVVGARVIIPKNTAPPYPQSYLDQASGKFGITMIHPPGAGPNLLFYPGLFTGADRSAVATQVFDLGTGFGEIIDIDKLAVPSGSLTGHYTVTSAYSTATEAELRAASTSYPDWLLPYQTFSDPGYRSPAVLQQVHDLAVQVTAGATNPYDQASAVERFLRTQFTYTLTPKTAPAGTDPLQYFLFTSKQGYCEYFATAMGDMLRSLGIPVRLVNGYGPGSYDLNIRQWVVRETDAHTWVEVYFPQYGWIPFEPTADGTYQVIQRGKPNPNLDCHPDCVPAGATGPKPAVSPRANGHGTVENPAQGGGAGGGGGLRLPGFLRALPPFQPLLAVAILLLVGAFVFVSRYLRPRNSAAAWRRTALLCRLAGAPIEAGETPFEYGRRLARAFPEIRNEIKRLVDNFVVAAYAPPARAAAIEEAVISAWEAVRPALLRRIAARRRPATA